MTTLVSRAMGFETLFERDLAQRFRITNRRNRLLGRWAAEAMAMPHAEAEAYARELVQSDLADPGRQEELHDRLYADLRYHGVDLSDHRLRRKMDLLMDEARQQILAEEELATGIG